jgi:putative thiamine transport system substrate-binding protein
MQNRFFAPLVTRRLALTGLGAAGLSSAWPTWAQSSAWTATEAKAKGQTVYFNAWAGSERINAYIQWAGEQLQQRFGVKLEHVKISDAADMIKRVRAEKTAGKRSDGSVDLVWINGENFLTMKREGLLFGPFAESLPNFYLVDLVGKPTTRLDFAEPTEGMEAPWGMAQLTVMADRKQLPMPPASIQELLTLAQSKPGRITYPKPPDFTGTTFVKQVLMELSKDHSALYKPMTTQAFASLTPALWTYLDALHPHLWRKGKQFPASPAAVRQMMSDGELLLAVSFNPNEAANEIASKRLADTVYTYQHKAGSIGNTHFVAIPFNAKAKEGAQVAANFFLSPEAQARKADITLWGDPTVLALDKLSSAQKASFAGKIAPGQLQYTVPTLAEPHGSWVDPLEKEWIRRYGV